MRRKLTFDQNKNPGLGTDNVITGPFFIVSDVIDLCMY